MKVFMVFIALLIINTTFITYQGDLNRYVRLQTYLKAVVEEAAAGAALYYDEEAYSYGLMVIKREEGEKYIENQISLAERKLGLSENSLKTEIIIVDDSDGVVNQGVPPSITITLSLSGRKLFRLPFINKDKVVRSTRYELAHY